MRFTARVHLSPAMIVATIALFVALAGTGVAAVSKLLPPNSVGTAQVVDNSLLKQDFKAGQIQSGALAFAHVNKDGTLDKAFSKNVAVTRADKSEQNTQAYCLDVKGGTPPRNVFATLDHSASANKEITVYMNPDFVDQTCTNADAVVVTALYQTGSRGANAFYVVFN